jgi:ribonuclease-3
MKFIRNIFNSRPDKGRDFFLEVKKLIGFTPLDLSIYKMAFTHRSLNLKNSTGVAVSYERLEFLGDAMLDAVISKYLYDKVPQGDEGYLTKMRSKIVSREHLNELGKELDLIKLLKSRIPKANFGNNVHGNLFEALVGAIFLDRGYNDCKSFIDQNVIIPHVDIETLESKVISYKSLFIEWCQKEKKIFNYDVYEDTGNEDIRHFSVKLYIDDKVIAKARATSKKKAEEKVSKRAFFVFQNQINDKP